VKRREVIALLGGAAASWPLAARGQQPKMPTIGFLGAATSSSWNQWTAAFVQRLRELGWIEGRNIVIEYRWAEGSSERAANIAAEFVWLKVDVIVSSGAVLLAARQHPEGQQATSMVPIVFATASEPVGTGLVASLARPGGNVTGLSNQQSDLATKRLELLREVLPALRQLAILANGSNPASLVEMPQVERTARAVGLEAITREIRRAEDFAPAFEAIKGRADALYVCSDFFMFTHRIRINTLTLGARLPTIFGEREMVEVGGLMSYGPNFPDLFRRAADYVDKILRGTKPGDLPVQQPTKFDLTINLTTAKVLGLNIPEAFLLRADEVIE
jgi:putative ABC transport system substrate-binding protein